MAQSRPREVSTPRGEKSDVLGREGEPPCEPAGIGEGSDGASPSHNGSIPTTRGIYPARGEKRRSGKGGRASVRAGGDRRRLGRSLALPKWLNPDHARYLPRAGRKATFWEGRASLRASRRGSEKARTEPRPPIMAQSRPCEVSNQFDSSFILPGDYLVANGCPVGHAGSVLDVVGSDTDRPARISSRLI